MSKTKEIVERIIEELDNEWCGRLTFGSGENRIMKFGIKVSEETAKAIFEDLEAELSVLERRYKNIPLKLKVFIDDVRKLKKKYLGDEE